MIQISNCPITGLERKVTHCDLLNKESINKIILTCYITHYKDGNPVNTEGIRSYDRELIASTDTPYNTITGERLADVPASWAIQGVVSEYAYFKGMENISIKQSDLKASVIAARDLEGKFNV